jgi:hypothetical protein
MFERLLALGLVKKPVSEQEKRKEEFARLVHSYDRALLYEQVWSKPAQEVRSCMASRACVSGRCAAGCRCRFRLADTGHVCEAATR